MNGFLMAVAGAPVVAQPVAEMAQRRGRKLLRRFVGGVDKANISREARNIKCSVYKP